MSAYVSLGDHFRTVLARDLMGMVLGDSICHGTHRHVFNHATNKDWIVKVENGAQSFMNIAEYQVWQSVKETKLAKWFAPVLEISPSGLLLIMPRCQVATINDDLPKSVPAFMTDLKPENWGWLDGRWVCLDYGLHLLHEHGMTSRMRKANWRG